jgi:4-alpha-glucanotransferase
MLKRGSGVLLHLSSLPSCYGIGDLGPSAHHFAEVVSQAGQRYWQLLPLNPTDGVYGESPYSSPSAFACNPLFISPDLLCSSGWLKKKDLKPADDFPRDRVDFSCVREYKHMVFHKAFDYFQQDDKVKDSFDAFCEEQSFWLDDYAMFMVMKDVYDGKRWDEWPGDIMTRKAAALRDIKKKYALEIEYIKFLQYVFSQQWQDLKTRCRQVNIGLIGDIPIYVNEDSADVWANPEFFKLDDNMRPKFVAGVPPDYFSTTGQRWGNPVYDWDQLKKKNYAWWMNRLQRQFDLFDIVRIDHFRGFETYWEIPAVEKTAVNGSWADGPKDAFFKILNTRFSTLPIIGEDLGIITKEVTALMERFQIPGMKVLQFAFSGDLSVHPYIPENYIENCVVYTGTHDNNTTRGWFCHDASEEERRNLAGYLHKAPDEQTIAWDLIEVALRSRAVLAVVPLQDLLNLGQEARMNVPGTAHNNWRWRFSNDIPDEVIARLKTLTQQTSR